MNNRQKRISILALATATLGWYAFSGITTAHRADQLCDAIHAENAAQVKSLLSKGIDPRWENSYGKTSLRVAEQHPDLHVLHLVQEAAEEK